MTEHITNLISKIAPLNTEINIKVNTLVQIHLYKPYEMRNYFQMSRDWFDVSLASTDNERKKERGKFNVFKKKM